MGNIVYDPDEDKCRDMRHLAVNFANWVGFGPAVPASSPDVTPTTTLQRSTIDEEVDDAFTSSPSTLKADSEEDEKLPVSHDSSPDAEKMSFEIVD
ncbi:hypothetical protein AC578_10710 [Pseudocercospora eumusae]|uniref:Uncharacterized protein n=1 Tax=Pseudocercospora eumusae TaxID=321146 RepID=A0A139GVL0_9PEZI|nr:hypothetical protein AC578_10710 [Pseudocercospora eumusae]